MPDRARHQRRRQDHQAVERAGRRRARPGDEETAKTGNAGVRSQARHARPGIAAYGIIVNPVDDSLWGATDEVDVPGQIFRLERGSNPPLHLQDRALHAAEGARLSAARHRRRPERRDLDGAGGQRPAGELRSPEVQDVQRPGNRATAGTATKAGRSTSSRGRRYKGTNIGADFNYYNWVDQFNTLGLGNNVPIANGSGSDSLLAFKPDTEASGS